VGPQASLSMVLLVYGLMAGLVLLQVPALAVPAQVLAAAFVPAAVSTGTGSRVNIVIIGLVALTAYWVVRMALDRELRPRRADANLPLLALILVSGFSIVAGAAMWNPLVVTKDNFILVQLAQWAVYVLSACAFWLAANLVRDRRVLGWLVVLLLALGGLFLVRLWLPPSGRITGLLLFESVNFRLWLVALGSGLALFHTGLARWVRGGLMAGAVLVLGAGFVFARDWISGWLPLLVVLATVGFLVIWEQRRKILFPMLMLLAAMGSSLLLLRAAGREMWSMNTRVIAWRGLVELLEGRWLFGLGLAAYWHYWRGILGQMSYLDPQTGYLHFTFSPQVNMHNNYLDVLGQMGVVGLVALAWLLWAIFRQARRVFESERPGFGKAYGAACLAGLAGMLFAGMLGDWFLPFVYNIGLAGLRDSFLAWLILGGLVVVEATAGSESRVEPAGPGFGLHAPPAEAGGPDAVEPA
jgi:hypothetical protein